MQFALISSSSKVSDRDLAFGAEALNEQAIECARAYGVEPMPVAFYANVDELPMREVRVCHIVDDLEHPGALGFHTWAFGVVYSRVKAQDAIGTIITASHEVLETLIDPFVDQWMPMGDGGRAAAKEVCDPVEADAYPVQVTLLGETRPVLVSNYVLPRWFDPAAPGDFDRMRKLSAPFSMTTGGYMIVMDPTGNETRVYARHGGERGMAGMGAKVANPFSRARKRLTGQGGGEGKAA